MTRYTMLNNALASGELAGSRSAAARLPRMVPTALYGAYLGVAAGDPEARYQFERGFCIGYDTARVVRRAPRSGADDDATFDDGLGDSFTTIADAAVKAAEKKSSSTPGGGGNDLSWQTPTKSPPTSPTNHGVYAPPKPAPAPYYPPTPAAQPPKPVVYQPPVKAGLFGLSRKMTIGLGVAAAAALAGGVYYGTREEEVSSGHK